MSTSDICMSGNIDVKCMVQVCLSEEFKIEQISHSSCLELYKLLFGHRSTCFQDVLLTCVSTFVISIALMTCKSMLPAGEQMLPLSNNLITDG